LSTFRYIVYASFAGMKAGAARLWMRPLVCRCYIQWLCNVCAACGTYVVKWMYFIISGQMVMILYIEVIQLALMCYCKRRKCILLSIYTLMMSLMMS
jgi:bacteriorhodopsin